MNTYQEKHMKRAIELSREGMREGFGGPFGAVVVRDGEILAEGGNCVTSTNDPTAHAEIVAIRRACEVLGSFQLTGCKIYASAEPCPMCLGAIYWARLAAVYYAAAKTDAATAGFDDSFIYDEIAKAPTDRTIPFIRIENSEALEIFQEWGAKEDKVQY